MELVWWHWMVLGLGSGLLELVVASFFVIWFGLGALLVGVAMLARRPWPSATQILLWTAASVAMTVLWFKCSCARAARRAPARPTRRWAKSASWSGRWNPGHRIGARRGAFPEAGDGTEGRVMGEFGIVVVAIFVFVAVTIAKGVRIVPQGEEWIVERLGKYHATLHPGLNIIIPYLDQVRYKLTTKDIILDVQEQEVITKDNAVILTNAIAFIKVTDPIKAVYGVTDFSEAIRNMIMTTLRSIIGEMSSTRRCPIATRSRRACARASPTRPSTGA
jgi:hypothetical protein